MTRTTIWSAIVALLLFLSALQSPVRADEIAPVSRFGVATERPSLFDVDASQNVRVEIARIRSGLLPGVIIGGHHEGVLKIFQQHYTASGYLDERLEEAVRHLVEDELHQAGYAVADSGLSSVFEEQLVDELEPSRFLLGGTITQAALNSYSSLLGDFTKEQRTIRWEVFDRDASKIVYRKETMGRAQAEGIQNPAATYEAVRASVRSLLAEPDFNTMLQQSTSLDTVSPASYEIPALASSNQSLTVEQITGRSVPSIVRVRTPTGRGSGFLIDSSGLVVTNQHVVGSAFSVKVDLYDGSTKIGRVMKRNAASDIALVKLEGTLEGMTGLPVCQTDAVRVGEPVVAIGNPLSLSNSVTQGIVSGIRTGSTHNLIQTDAAINPGNSGGPLLNQQGIAIGIVTEKISSRGVEGLGFALPIGESLQKLNVKVNSLTRSPLHRCGNPLVAHKS